MTYSAPQQAEPMQARPFKQLTYVQIGDIPCTTGPALGYVCILDTGTTGTDPVDDHICDLAWMVLGVDAYHQICEMHGPWSHYGPWPGHDGETHVAPDLQMFLGHLNRCQMVVAHNARFDEAMLRKALPQLPSREVLPWACSLRDIAWNDHGVWDTRLKDLLEVLGMCHNAHDTVDDVVALSWVMSRQLSDGSTVLQTLIRWVEALKVEFSVVAKTPAARRALKRRGYHFDDACRSQAAGAAHANKALQTRPHWTRHFLPDQAKAEYCRLMECRDLGVQLDVIFARVLFGQGQSCGSRHVHQLISHTKH